MMKLAKGLLGVLVVLVAVLLVGGWLLSPTFTVTRSVLVSAPPAKVYALVVDPREWKKWTVWNRRAPAMQITYSDPPSGLRA